MKKPNRDPQVISEELTRFSLQELTIEEVSALFYYMEANYIDKVFLQEDDFYDNNYENCKSMQSRMETEDEAEARYQRELKLYEKEIKRYDKLRANKLAKLKQDAADLGYTINEIQTDKSKGKSKTK
jgi:hypothetical protein